MTKVVAELVDSGGFTPREGQIAVLLCEGLSDKAIARTLAMSTKTLENHLEHMYQKLQVRRHSVNTRVAAVLAMVARGMVRLSVNTLCVWLMVSAVGLDDPARVGRAAAARPAATRLRAREV